MNTQDRLVQRSAFSVQRSAFSVQRSAFRGLVAPFLYLNMVLIT